MAENEFQRPSSFLVMITGQIESAFFPSNIDSIYCRYGLVHGPDWNIIHGIDGGISQISSRKNQMLFQKDNDGIVWNFPIDIALKSTNAFGWPRLAISIYGLDALGRDVVRGYGSMLIPTYPGRFIKYVDTYVPVSKNICQGFLNWVFGTPPEFYDMKATAQNDGRALIRVRSEGCVKVIINVVTKDMGYFGYIGRKGNEYSNSGID
jgi:B9 domain-containing protein 1